MQHKTKMFACFAFFPDGSVKRWKYVRNLKSFGDFLAKDHSTWKYFNVYDKGTKAYLKRFYPGNLIPKVLPTLIIFLAVLSTQKFTFNKTFAQRATLAYENTFNKTTFTKTTFINGIYNSATISTDLTPKGGAVC